MKRALVELDDAVWSASVITGKHGRVIERDYSSRDLDALFRAYRRIHNPGAASEREAYDFEIEAMAKLKAQATGGSA